MELGKLYNITLTVAKRKGRTNQGIETIIKQGKCIEIKGNTLTFELDDETIYIVNKDTIGIKKYGCQSIIGINK